MIICVHDFVHLCVCLCCKRKMAKAIASSTPELACTDLRSKGQKVKVRIRIAARVFLHVNMMHIFLDYGVISFIMI